jgi:hypothetical protein
MFCAELKNQTNKFSANLFNIKTKSDAAGLLAEWCISINNECGLINEITKLEQVLFNDRQEFMV